MSNFTDVHKPWLNYRINELQIDTALGTKNATFEATGTADFNGIADFTGATVIGLPSDISVPDGTYTAPIIVVAGNAITTMTATYDPATQSLNIGGLAPSAFDIGQTTLGRNAQCTGAGSGVAIGRNAKAGNQAVAIGGSSLSGNETEAGSSCISVGENAKASDVYAQAIGEDTVSSGRYTIAQAKSASNTATQASICMGCYAEQSGDNSILIGPSDGDLVTPESNKSTCSGDKSTVIGYHNTVAHDSCVILGNGITSAAAGEINISNGGVAGKVFLDAPAAGTKSNILYYDSATNEVVYGAAASGGGNYATGLLTISATVIGASVSGLAFTPKMVKVSLLPATISNVETFIAEGTFTTASGGYMKSYAYNETAGTSYSRSNAGLQELFYLRDASGTQLIGSGNVAIISGGFSYDITVFSGSAQNFLYECYG